MEPVITPRYYFVLPCHHGKNTHSNSAGSGQQLRRNRTVAMHDMEIGIDLQCILFGTFSVYSIPNNYYEKNKTVSMKQFVKLSACAIALVLVGMVTPAVAEGGPYSKFAAITPAAENNFSIALQKKDNEEVVCLQIENFARKTLRITLLDPEGNVLDAFVTSRKFMKMSRDYNFTGASEGLYKIVISGGPREIRKQVRIEHVAVSPVVKLSVQ